MRDGMHNHRLHPHIVHEREMWETIRDIGIKKGRLHPASRYSSWEAFVDAGFPWHNHGDDSFTNLSIGDNSRRWEAKMHQETIARREASMSRPRYDPMSTPEGGYGFCNVGRGRGGVRSMTEEIIASRGTGDTIPASARLSMIAAATGGYGAADVTVNSSEPEIARHLDAIARGGHRSPGELRLA